MASSELIILDVGHGNCSIIVTDGRAIVIDAPARPVVAETLDELGIKVIHALLISHADSDHLSGAIPLILNNHRPVEHLYVNPDKRRSDTWNNFRQAISTARRANNSGMSVHPSLSMSDSGSISLGSTTLKVLHPQPEMCLTGTGGKDLSGFEVDANNMSAVILVEHEGDRVCLLAADSDQNSLSCMVEESLDLRAPILVFPHHGGSGAKGHQDNIAFAKNLVRRVEPQVVLFSLGRGRHGTPRPEIIEGVRSAIDGDEPYIACTQLSANCSESGFKRSKEDVGAPGDGIRKDATCAGTVTIRLGAKALNQLKTDLARGHGQFVIKNVPKALCRRTFSRRLDM